MHKNNMPRFIYIMIAFSDESFFSKFASLIHQEFEMVSSSDIYLLFSALDNKYEGENDVMVNVLK